MNRTVKGRIRTGIILLTVYAALIVLLVQAESGAEDALITGIPSALWYSVTTLTTVGYGDTYPVTGLGKVIGFIFQMMSLGVLAALAGFLIRAFRTQLLPKMMLASKRDRIWAVFSSDSFPATVLAEKLKQENPDYEILFAAEGESVREDLPGIRLSASVREVAGWQKGKGKCLVFCTDESRYENRRLAQSMQNTEAEVYCLSSDEPDMIPDHQTYFNEASCTARMYWRKYPVLNPGETIVIAGEGPLSEALLEQGLMVNIISPDQTVRYILPGDWSEFRRNHPYLPEAAAFGEKDGSGDSIRFTEKPWNQDWNIYKNADRIILCFENETENAGCLSALRRYCPVSGKIFVRDNLLYENAVSFGRTEEIYTPELVMKRSLNRLAESLHNSYLKQNAGRLPDWNHLSEFLRRSNLASADHLYMKALILTGKTEAPAETELKNLYREAAHTYRNLRPEEKVRCRRIEHMRWNRFHLLNNWQYAQKRDNSRRLHPLILPFDSLSETDRAKDDYAWELLDQAAEN